MNRAAIFLNRICFVRAFASPQKDLGYRSAPKTDHVLRAGYFAWARIIDSIDYPPPSTSLYTLPAHSSDHEPVIGLVQYFPSY